MIHYLLIRRDLPFGTCLAQLAHAAGNSVGEWMVNKPPLITEWADPMTVVVLGVRNQRVLLSWIRRLNKQNIKYTVVREPDEPWNGEAMAIGVWPGEREKLAPVFSELQTYTEFEGPRNLEDVR